MTHKLLQRQLRRMLGVGDAAQLAGLLADLKSLAQSEPVSETTRRSLSEFGAFLQQVDDAYVQNERSLELSTRSLELSSSELGQANETLRTEATAREKALQTLRDTANQLLQPLGQHIGHDAQSLGRLTELLAGLVHDLIDAQRQAESAYNKLRNQQFALDQHAIVSITDPDGKILYANERFCEISKFRREDLVGVDHRIVNSGLHSKEFFAEMWQTICAGKVWHGEVRNKASDGSYYWVAATVVPFLDAQGQPYEYISMRTDISERKRAEEELRQSDVKQRMLLDNAADAVFVVGQDRQMLYVNELAVSLLGYSHDELVGKWFIDLLPAEFVSHYFDDLRDNLFETGRAHAETTFRSKAGSTIPVELNVAILPDRNFYISCRDITLRKEVEATLLAAKEAAEANSRAKSDFLATMSHEIRTPMNGIIVMTELALETHLTADQREYLGLVKTSADHLLTIINDILDFSKIESGKMLLEHIEFDFAALLLTTVKLLTVQAQAKGLHLRYELSDDIPDLLVGDPGRLRQVLINLVGNAIKFTDRGEIVIGVTRRATTGQTIQLYCEVTDQGIGIAADKLSSIFEAFTQADTSTTRRYGGTGLGLAICSQLVSAMGGTLGVRSELGHGSSFHFDVQLEMVSKLPLGSTLEVGLAGVPVLIVDDNPTNQRLLSQMVKKWGMSPTSASSATEAIFQVRESSARGNPFSLVILDAMMPQVDGFELASQLAQAPEMSGAIMMMLSSSGMRGDAQRCRELGVMAYLTKPIDQTDLYHAIHTALRSTPDSVLITRHNLTESPPFQQLNVLLVEDNPINQKLALTLLSKWGHKVDLAADGEHAVAMSNLQVYDVILMDLQMPKMGGLEATQLIRQRERGSNTHTPIVAMTANAMDGDRERCRDAGMEHYVAKPLKADVLRQLLAGLRTGVGAESPSASIDPVEHPGNFDYAHALSESDAWIVETIGQAFLDECPNLLNDLRTATRDRDHEALIRHAHTLRGLVGNFLARPVEVISQRLEAAGHLGQTDRAILALDQLTIELAPMTQALAAHLAKLSSGND